MKAGSFNLNDYLQRLHEEQEANSKVPEEGIIIPEENKKTFAWLKKEYQKGKTEVKVEMKMGGSKFEPGYDLQSNAKSVNDFKPGMFGDVKTSDTEGSKKKEEGQPESKSSAEKPSKEAPKKIKGVGIKGLEAEEKESKEEDKKKPEESKKKLHEGFEIVQRSKGVLDREAMNYISNLPMTRKPEKEDLYYIKKIKVDSQLETILNFLPVVDFDTYEDLLGEYNEELPKQFFIANVLEEEGVSFLVDRSGYEYARYIAELI